MGSLLISMTSLFTEYFKYSKYCLPTAKQAINPVRQLMATDPRATIAPSGLSCQLVVIVAHRFHTAE